jgi:hypothetical protein
VAGPLDLLIPPRLIIRAADDLHRMVAIAERALDHLDRLDRRVDTMLEMGARIEGQAEAVLGLGERISGQAEGILTLGEQVSGQAEGIRELGDRIDELGRHMLEQGLMLERQADAVATRAGELVEALPTLEQAVTMVTPLEGAVERLGRAVDRLPGGGRRAAGATKRGETEGSGQGP